MPHRSILVHIKNGAEKKQTHNRSWKGIMSVLNSSGHCEGLKGHFNPHYKWQASMRGKGGEGMNGWLNKWKQWQHQQQQHKEANHSAS
jgi:hypothetical protein